MADTLTDFDWEILLGRISTGSCTPFLGAGACFGFVPLGQDIARSWAKEKGYPLEDTSDLVRVAQFVAVSGGDPAYPKEQICNQLKTLPKPDFRDPQQPHGVLADLPLPIYITTNYDDFMEEALRSRSRNPKVDFCRWHPGLRDSNSDLVKEDDYQPTKENPLVFHLHGHWDNPDSLVLTEDDYLDFLVAISEDKMIIPSCVQKAFTQTSLLFLGYKIADWDFRVIFRNLVTYMRRSQIRKHISVQLLPVSENAGEEQKQNVQKYLGTYFGELKISIFWGACTEFVQEFRRRWDLSRVTQKASL